MNKKVLIVDDDNDILEPLAILLQEEGYDVQTTSKGTQTFTKVESYKPDLILLDILMSGSDGRNICKKLKRTKATKHIPIVMMSAHPGSDKDSISCGADTFIAKPFEADDLLALLRNTLQ